MGFKIRILSIIELIAYFAQELHSYTNFLVNKRRQVLLKRIANRGQGSNPGEGNLVIFVNFFGFLLIFLSLLIIGL